MTDGEKNAGRALELIVTGLKLYASSFHRTLGIPLGDDHVIGQDWKDAAAAVIHMMNGPSGEADRTKLAGELRAIALRDGLGEF